MALSDNLVVYYSLDEASGNAIDAHSTKDLTDNNTVGAGTGKVNGGRDFALASSEHFTHADDAVFNPSGDFTYAFWCKADTLTFGTSYVLISKDSASPAGNYYIWHNGSINRFNFQVFGSESYGNLGSVEANNLGQPSAGNWYFIVVRHNATADTISIQVNNGTVDSISHSAGVLDNSSTFYLGGDVYGRYWDGLIDEVGLWHRVLTADEGTELYNSGAGRDYAYITGAANETLTAETATFAITGNAANLLWHQRVVAETASFAITGNAAELLWHQRLLAATATYTLTGNDATLVEANAETLIAAAGSFAITGNAANLLWHDRLVAAAAPFTITGNAATLTESGSPTLVAASGSFVLTGNAATLSKQSLSDSSGPSYGVSPIGRTNRVAKYFTTRTGRRAQYRPQRNYTRSLT